MGTFGRKYLRLANAYQKLLDNKMLIQDRGSRIL